LATTLPICNPSPDKTHTNQPRLYLHGAWLKGDGNKRVEEMRQGGAWSESQAEVCQQTRQTLSAKVLTRLDMQRTIQLVGVHLLSQSLQNKYPVKVVVICGFQHSTFYI
jgi:hypothetical protein